jgi:hypothetical protein
MSVAEDRETSTHISHLILPPRQGTLILIECISSTHGGRDESRRNTG